MKKGDNTKIARLENYLFHKYNLRINIITNELEGKLINDKEFEFINLSDIHYELSHAGFTRYREDLNTLFASSRIERFDPFKDYFEKLPIYDTASDPDYIQELTKFIVTESQKWFEIVFKKFLVQMAGQSIGSIDFNKHCLTFVGRQHDGKTTFLEWIVPSKLRGYIKKGFDFGGKKEAKFSLVQNILINLDELASFDRKELNNEFKSVLSESIVKFRPLYSNQEVTFKRRASFTASTNQLEFLTDETGNVRWLIFKITKILHDNGGQGGYTKNVNLDKVWAQAYHLLNAGFEYNLTKNEVEFLEKENKKFVKTTDEMEFIRSFFQPSDEKSESSEFMTTKDITDTLIRHGITRTNRNFVGKALRAEGFHIASKYYPEKKYSIKGYWVTYDRFPQNS